MEINKKVIKELKDCLDEFDLNVSPNLLMDKILLSIKDATDKTFPLRKVSNKQARKILNPWMTNEILKEQKKLQF